MVETTFADTGAASRAFAGVERGAADRCTAADGRDARREEGAADMRGASARRVPEPSRNIVFSRALRRLRCSASVSTCGVCGAAGVETATAGLGLALAAIAPASARLAKAAPPRIVVVLRKDWSPASLHQYQQAR